MSKGTILCVEDNRENRLLLRRVLEAEGYQVVEAGSAEEALACLENGKPHLILMDINMPNVDGYTLTAQIKSQPGFKDVPIIAVTANVMRGDRERILGAGCDGYIQKPIDIDALTYHIERYLTRSSRD
ncbi:MAG: response regulator [Anaerolineae bacterium]|nr:MAG: response regulator [Anaerolineae bacterium]